MGIHYCHSKVFSVSLNTSLCQMIDKHFNALKENKILVYCELMEEYIYGS